MEAIEVTVDSQNSENSVRQQKQKVNAQINQKPEAPTNAKPKQTRRANKRKRSKTPTPGSRQSTVTKKFEKPTKSTRRLKIQKASTKPDAVGPTVTKPPTVSPSKPTVPFKPRPRPLKKLMKCRTMSLLSISSASRVARRFPRRRNNPVPMEATKVTVDSQNSKNSVGQKEKQKEKQKVTQTPTTAKPKPTRRANKRKHSKTATVTQKTTKPNQENL
ncbi:hypothetical protein CRE_22984 [Caenorhabditis remanei]|uniref:Uncharacterized protein n=1 Tax=Caenorhabditis remanei TaxID=31234 RepID=E3MW80_CAERE|nr:hypothetical protein CRE_22984 [Caenorhabditis remanei]